MEAPNKWIGVKISLRLLKIHLSLPEKSTEPNFGWWCLNWLRLTDPQHGAILLNSMWCSALRLIWCKGKYLTQQLCHTRERRLLRAHAYLGLCRHERPPLSSLCRPLTGRPQLPRVSWYSSLRVKALDSSYRYKILKVRDQVSATSVCDTWDATQINLLRPQ